jgi:predicted nucleic acid-binding Zn ribbon protein
MNRRPRREPRAVGALLDGVLGDLGLDDTAAAVRIADQWEALVGSEVARHARPAALRGNVLEIAVDGSAWCQELQLRRSELLTRLRRALGEAAPTDLWLRVG